MLTPTTRELDGIGGMIGHVQEDHDKNDTTNRAHIIEAPYRTCCNTQKREKEEKRTPQQEQKTMTTREL